MLEYLLLLLGLIRAAVHDREVLIAEISCSVISSRC
jgi:hypothetical protein